MRYALLICTPEKWQDTLTEAEATDLTGRYIEWSEKVGASGKLLGGERLRPTSDATTVRVRDGEVLTSDGPFAETKEQVGGYYIVDAVDLDEAIQLASEIPGAAHGAIEVRPIWEM